MLFRKAILIVHGFGGSMCDQEELARYLELNKNFDVFQFTLPGHEERIYKARYNDWITASEEMVQWLINKGYKNIYVIGHSMGGVIATYLATKYKQINKLILVAPAFQYLNVEKDDLNISKSLHKTPAIIKTYGGAEIISRFLKLNPGAIKEFMSLIKKYYDCPKDVTCDTLLLQGKSDDIVPLSSSEYVYNTIKSKNKKIIYLNNVTHDVFRAENKNEIFVIIEKNLRHNISGGKDEL